MSTGAMQLATTASLLGAGASPPGLQAGGQNQGGSVDFAAVLKDVVPEEGKSTSGLTPVRTSPPDASPIEALATVFSRAAALPLPVEQPAAAFVPTADVRFPAAANPAQIAIMPSVPAIDSKPDATPVSAAIASGAHVTWVAASATKGHAATPTAAMTSSVDVTASPATFTVSAAPPGRARSPEEVDSRLALSLDPKAGAAADHPHRDKADASASPDLAAFMIASCGLAGVSARSPSAPDLPGPSVALRSATVIDRPTDSLPGTPCTPDLPGPSVALRSATVIDCPTDSLPGAPCTPDVAGASVALRSAAQIGRAVAGSRATTDTAEQPLPAPPPSTEQVATPLPAVTIGEIVIATRHGFGQGVSMQTSGTAAIAATPVRSDTDLVDDPLSIEPYASTIPSSAGLLPATHTKADVVGRAAVPFATASDEDEPDPRRSYGSISDKHPAGPAGPDAASAGVDVLTSRSATPPLVERVVGTVGALAPQAAAVPEIWAQPRVAPARTMRLELAPEGLGTLSVRLHAVGGALDVRLDASDPKTTSLLDEHRDALAAALNDEGYKLGSLDIGTHGAIPQGNTHAARTADPGPAHADNPDRRGGEGGGDFGPRRERERKERRAIPATRPIDGVVPGVGAPALFV